LIDVKCKLVVDFAGLNSNADWNTLMVSAVSKNWTIFATLTDMISGKSNNNGCPLTIELYSVDPSENYP
jgi:hypothetical protein